MAPIPPDHSPSCPDHSDCALACKALHQICTPFLWRAVKVKASRPKASKEDAAQQALHRNASHVSELHLLYASLFHIFLPRKKDTTLLGYENMYDSERERKEVEEGYLPALCINLQALRLYRFDNSMEDPYGDDGIMSRDREDLYEYPGLELGIAALVRQNPRLVRLEFGPLLTEELLIPMVTEDLPHLEFLDIKMPFMPTESKYILENLPEGIKEVCLVVYSRFLMVSSMFTPPKSARSKSHRAFMSLKIDELDDLEEFILLPFWRPAKS
ncbi:hypothetical protein MVEG_12152 [Podila verticillata NRRL 6337]|uniref:F-box domain-containing protein n=1 Tax=Podila verticillata NRRL 6337 TaxID=1069443 RepID=A0A086TJ71_9FUNG|nr:hypothetical protein MVEG_12152 [Podila verticillata NRRL 6337]